MIYSNISSWQKVKEAVRRLKTIYREKYKYKNRGEMIVGVKELINEKMKSDEYDEELNDLSFLLRCLFWVY